jgi:hypothetical protein
MTFAKIYFFIFVYIKAYFKDIIIFTLKNNIMLIVFFFF